MRFLTVIVALLYVSPALADRVNGKWSALDQWPLMPIHQTLLKDGRVYYFGTDGTGTLGAIQYGIWTPGQGHQILDQITLTDIFCAGVATIPDSGRIVTFGGNNPNPGAAAAAAGLTVLRPDDGTIAAGPDIWRKRWYPTVTVLSDGDMLVQGGRRESLPRGGVSTPEVVSPNFDGVSATARLLHGATDIFPVEHAEKRWFYPRAWVAPSGRVYTITGPADYWLDPAGQGTIYAKRLIWQYNSKGRTSTAAMYGRGKILQVGGGLPLTKPATKDGLLIDINADGAATLTALPDLLHRARHWADATILPDGRVLINGGSENDRSLAGVVAYRPEIYDPARMTSTLMGAPEAVSRLYHSASTLLRDGTVLSGGGGSPGPETNLSAQVYAPPYLFNAGGGMQARPRINSVARVLPYDSNIDVQVDNGGSGGIVRMTMIKHGTITHSFNSEQRFIEVPWTRQGSVITIRTPATPALATPGYYMLHAIGANGAPSKAWTVRLDQRRQPVPGAARNRVSDSRFWSVVDVPDGGSTPILVGAYFGGWELTQGRAVARRSGLSQSIALDGAIEQHIDGLQVGHSYKLTFGGSAGSAQVSMAGASRSFLITQTGARSMTITATEASHKLVVQGQITLSYVKLEDV